MHKKYGKAGLDAYVAVKRQEKDHNFSHGSCIRGYYNQQYWSDFAIASEEWLNYETFEGCLVEYGTRFAD